ncbi:hypothetical protein [Qipengyuania sp. ASV99]|uniref:hypothetical protein n=1 Tax=Qipengyuania sp. ASV99 TaxID=3399681 RepID=UPI003A4C52FC
MMNTLTAILAALALQAAPAATDDALQEDSSAVSSQTEAETAASPQQAAAEEAEEITDRSHPDYMRCRRESVIGSNARKRRVCMTNREWELAASTGNSGAREIVESQQVGIRSE